MFGLIGEKLGMTQVYDASGKLIPVTVVRMQPNLVTAVRTKEKNGYSGVQLGYGSKREKNIKKPQLGFFKKNKLRPVALLKEFRTDDSEKFKVGSEIKVGAFVEGDTVDVQSISKGRGFQGVMKRWNFAGGPDSHGCSVAHRVPGSIGQGTSPGKVWKGKKMPGQMGDAKVKIKNLKIFSVEDEQDILLISGAVPGAKNAKLFIYNHSSDFVKRIVETDGEDKADSAEAKDSEKKAEESAA